MTAGACKLRRVRSRLDNLKGSHREVYRNCVGTSSLDSFLMLEGVSSLQWLKSELMLIRPAGISACYDNGLSCVLSGFLK